MHDLETLLALDDGGPWRFELPPELGDLLLPIDKRRGEKGKEPKSDFFFAEAIAAADLAGATMLRETALEFLRANRSSTDRDERLLENALRVRLLLQQASRASLDSEFLELLHREAFRGILADEDLGVLRGRDVAPADDELPASDAFQCPLREPREFVAALLPVVNADPGSRPHLHPVLKAGLVHALVQVMQPFRRGSSAIARFLCVRQLLRDDYPTNLPMLSVFLVRARTLASDVPGALATRDLTPLVVNRLRAISLAAGLNGP